ECPPSKIEGARRPLRANNDTKRASLACKSNSTKDLNTFKLFLSFLFANSEPAASRSLCKCFRSWLTDYRTFYYGFSFPCYDARVVTSCCKTGNSCQRTCIERCFAFFRNFVCY